MGRKKLEESDKLVLLRVFVAKKHLDSKNKTKINVAVELSLERYQERKKEIKN